MKIVVVAGQARKVGKTSVVAGLIRGLRRLHWTAVKISTHRYGVPHSDDAASGGDGNPNFILTEETTPSAFTDTGRFLAAGARRALWLRVKSDGWQGAVASLLESLAGDETVIIESGSIMNLVAPKVGILVLDRSRREMKANARRALARAAAVVEIRPAGRRPSRALHLPPRVRRFTVRRKDYSNPKLNRFVLLELRRLENSHLARPRPVGDITD